VADRPDIVVAGPDHDPAVSGAPLLRIPDSRFWANLDEWTAVSWSYYVNISLSTIILSIITTNSEGTHNLSIPLLEHLSHIG